MLARVCLCVCVFAIKGVTVSKEITLDLFIVTALCHISVLEGSFCRSLYLVVVTVHCCYSCCHFQKEKLQTVSEQSQHGEQQGDQS